MKIGVSNLAWSPDAEARAFDILSAGGAVGVEVAPTRIAAWSDLTPERLARFRASCDAAGLEIPSLQAIFFGKPELQLLADEGSFHAMCEHMQQVGAVAEALGAKVAVFGAPRNRSRGDLSEADAVFLATERLRRLGDVVNDYDLTIGMEPVPAYYGSDFVATASELISLLRQVDHPRVRFHMDCACVTLAGDDPGYAVREGADLLVHYHASEPDLGPFESPACEHSRASSALLEIGYSGWIVIEMRQQGENGLDATRQALAYVLSAYR